MSQAKENLLKIKKEFDELRVKARTAAKGAFDEGSKELFDQNPKLESFSWTQYTPYFLDGDVCEFGVNRHYTINDIDKYGDEYSDDGLGTWDQRSREFIWNEKGLQWKALKDKIDEFMNIFNDEDFEFMFGDHVEITVNRLGAFAEHYEHD